MSKESPALSNETTILQGNRLVGNSDDQLCSDNVEEKSTAYNMARTTKHKIDGCNERREESFNSDAFILQKQYHARKL